MYCDNLHLGNGSFFLQLIVSVNCFIKSAPGIQRSRSCGMRWATPTQRLRNDSSILWRYDRSNRGGGGTCGRTNWIRLHEVCCYVILGPCCCFYMKRGAARWKEERSDKKTQGLLNGVSCTVFKLTDVPTSLLQVRKDCCKLEKTAARKRQRFGSGGAEWTMGTKVCGWYLFCGGGG